MRWKEIGERLLYKGRLLFAGHSSRELGETRNHPTGAYRVPGQKGPDFYDATFFANESWRYHYTQSGYYFLWAVIVDRIRHLNVRRVLEVGCGTGQLALAISDAEIIDRYIGLDFSRARIDQARLNCPNLRFEVADAFETDLFQTYDYDLVLATEFLEHVQEDLTLLGAIRPGAHFIGTVPNFPFVSHVRYFRRQDEVVTRYESYFEDIKVNAFLANESGKTFFIVDGIRK